MVYLDLESFLSVNPPEMVCAIGLLFMSFSFVFESCLIFELPVPLDGIINAGFVYPRERTSSKDSTFVFPCFVGDLF
jgi:hypothetical protein